MTHALKRGDYRIHVILRCLVRRWGPELTEWSFNIYKIGFEGTFGAGKPDRKFAGIVVQWLHPMSRWQWSYLGRQNLSHSPRSTQRALMIRFVCLWEEREQSVCMQQLLFLSLLLSFFRSLFIYISFYYEIHFMINHKTWSKSNEKSRLPLLARRQQERQKPEYNTIDGLSNLKSFIPQAWATFSIHTKLNWELVTWP